ncbi:DUF3619 family protein [Roseateles asaccharophilus]|uniref:DUF3619 family protein n=1 Tax=Roseateles asaccharophilus TaxID=582607 RepID=A0ABU2A5V6_9BURK|nr:DUF3619 family protein [Roseateles asaccharophilus]MDR7331428.1 hypothetical protein [Roseateles asaccharophilus]
MKSTKYSPPADELDARMARFGRGVGAALTERSASLPHDVSERLRFGREQALARAAQARAAAAATAIASPATAQVGATLALGGHGGSMMGPTGSRPGGAGLWSMLMSALPVLLLVAGLMLMEMGQENEQIAAAAEVDTALLSDSLPPAAFTDPGFSEFLRDAEE